MLIFFFPFSFYSININYLYLLISIAFLVINSLIINKLIYFEKEKDIKQIKIKIIKN
jgi:hypothetical protein